MRKILDMEKLHNKVIISGFNKLTLLDYPGLTACIIFTQGCNYKCPFCHNASLIDSKASGSYDEEEILKFLIKRRNVLEGICISGGEPLMQKELVEFLIKIKDIGYKIKIDTNGSCPDILKYLIDNKLIDYVAMDIKNDLDNYKKTAGITNTDSVKKSIDILLNSDIGYEFRTTVVKELHTVNNIINIAKMIKNTKKYYLQKFIDSGDIVSNNLHSFSDEEMLNIKKEIEKYIPTVEVRGI
ncbi:MAG TPA: anaerobic ribonucleoside-triphosphate reductase activating protein [Bacilli bacterium]|nr:anaerobic ribonucleoside-triphosphate reductase activating protein [Bacilli bacterium]